MNYYALPVLQTSGINIIECFRNSAHLFHNFSLIWILYHGVYDFKSIYNVLIKSYYCGNIIFFLTEARFVGSGDLPNREGIVRERKAAGSG